MIKLFLFSLLVIVLALLLTLYLGFPADPGYILLAFGNYTFETSIFALLVALAVIYLFYRLLLLFWHSVNPWYWILSGRQWREQRNAKARSKTIDGMLYFARANWRSAYKLLSGGRNDKDASVINYLAAAYAAHEAGDREAWSRLLNEAEIKYPSARSTTNYVRALLLFKSDQLEQCLLVLEQQRKSAVNDGQLLSLQKDVYIRLNAWNQLEELLPALEKQQLVENDELERIRVRLFMEHLYAAGKSSAASADPDTAVAAMSRIWKKAPSAYKEDEKVVKHYVDLLCGVNAGEEAVKVVEHALSKKWSDALVLLYGEKDFASSAGQLVRAERWLKSRPGSTNLLLTLARLSLRSELWGKAREYYEASIKQSPSAAAYAELARLLKQLGDDRAGVENLKKYGEISGCGLPNLPLPKLPAPLAK